MTAVRLEESEQVAGRGSRRTTWWVQQEQQWIPAVKVAGCTVEKLATGPGVVWSRALWLDLSVGTLVTRVIAEPMVQRPRSTLDHLLLTSGPASTRRTRSTYRVDARGRLVTLPRPSES